MKMYGQQIVSAQSGRLTLERARQAARTAKSSRPGGSDLIVSSPRGQSLYSSFLGLITVTPRHGALAGTVHDAGGGTRKSAAKKSVAKKKLSAKKKVVAKKRVAVFKKVATKKKVARKK